MLAVCRCEFSTIMGSQIYRFHTTAVSKPSLNTEGFKQGLMLHDGTCAKANKSTKDQLSMLYTAQHAFYVLQVSQDSLLIQNQQCINRLKSLCVISDNKIISQEQKLILMEMYVWLPFSICSLNPAILSSVHERVGDTVMSWMKWWSGEKKTNILVSQVERTGKWQVSGFTWIYVIHHFFWIDTKINVRLIRTLQKQQYQMVPCCYCCLFKDTSFVPNGNEDWIWIWKRCVFWTRKHLLTVQNKDVFLLLGSILL